MEYLRPGSDSVVECPVCHSQEFYEGETEYKLRCSDCSFIMEFEFPPYAKRGGLKWNINLAQVGSKFAAPLAWGQISTQWAVLIVNHMTHSK